MLYHFQARKSKILSVHFLRHVIKPVIDASFFQKLLMRPFFLNPILRQHQNPVGIPDAGQPVGDGQGGPPLGQSAKGPGHRVLALIVQGRGGFIQDDHGRIL